MTKEYCDMLFESRAVDKLNVEDSATKISIIPESEIATSTDPGVLEFISKRFNIPDNPE
ncbi:hypothetical protein [Streptococcus sp. HMSC056C01]|uniref:hypothetical protein n=1 Tax=Streptococcus sp. HMSC056C01 TaxID=1739299 RepID=UPI00164B16EF|nr:hypothetical protein [Streptococcus sp. HMSC056C01]DAO79380.1 MAG TPA: hypothetical protein [Caudoviricetes sp.]